MRVQLSGYIHPPDPITIILHNGVPFVKAPYIDAGYNTYDVICIGAAGGYGGGWSDSGGSCGGAGGGGGSQRVQGLLADLSSSADIVVGVAGADGADSDMHSEHRGASGSDGGYSSFDTTVAQASGGKGGSAAKWKAPGGTPQPDTTGQPYGGAGGIGGTTTAGGGGTGGTITSDFGFSGGVAPPNPPGGIGTWDGTIGSGGGGGGGGYYTPFTIGALWLAGLGGNGAYSVTDPSIQASGGSYSNDPTFGKQIKAGAGAGAKTTPITALPTIYGSKGQGFDTYIPDGIVVIRLTQEN